MGVLSGHSIPSLIEDGLVLPEIKLADEQVDTAAIVKSVCGNVCVDGMLNK